MKKLFLISIMICTGLASFSFEPVLSYDFGSDITEVERHYFRDRWIHEVQTADSLYLVVDDSVHSFYSDLPFDVVVCGDSVVMVGWYEDSTGEYCAFSQLYPEHTAATVLPGAAWNKFCIWDEDSAEILYIHRTYEWQPLERENLIYAQYVRSYSLDTVLFSDRLWYTDVEFTGEGPILHSRIMYLGDGYGLYHYMRQDISYFSDEALVHKNTLPRGNGNYEMRSYYDWMSECGHVLRELHRRL